ncbi:MAG: cadherin-like domain-containing protein, partial [Pseudomonadales bacterium]|nr:cadherin-like domain-containing protein [Pseudomonadales bacterium]
EVKLERSENNNLTLRLGASSDAVVLQDYFWQATENDSLGNPTAMTGKIDTIEFFDGTVWTPTQIEKMDLTIVNTRGGVYLQGGDGNDSITGVYGYVGGNTLMGGAGNDVLSSGWDNDTLDGESGNDTLVAGQGNDSLTGGLGNDTYIYNIDDDSDVIYNREIDNDTTTDILTFGEGIIKANLVFSRTNDDLIITGMGDYNDQVTLQGYYSDNGTKIDAITFADGTQLSAAEIEQQPRLLSGGDGDDALQGADGKDTLSGGLGIDTLRGGAGDDIYQFRLGDGQDIIFDESGYDGIELLPTYIQNSDGSFGGYSVIAPADVITTRQQEDLVISFKNSTDTITIAEYYASSNYKIDYLRFADGTVWSSVQLGSMVINGTEGDDPELFGTVSDDIINGLSGNDVIRAGAGNDIVIGGSNWSPNDNDALFGDAGDDGLIGGAGSDTYLFARGDGKDTVLNYHQQFTQDVIYFGPTISIADLIAYRQEGYVSGAIDYQTGQSVYTSTNDDLILGIKGTSDSITVVDYFKPDTFVPYQADAPWLGGESINYKIDRIIFVDGSSLDSAQIEQFILFSANKPPVLQDDTVEIFINEPVTVDVLQNDSDPEAGALLVDTATVISGSGNIVVNSNNTLTFTPETGFEGLATIEYVVRDAGGASSSAKLTVNVLKSRNLLGTTGADMLVGRTGNDTLTGGKGNDTLQGNGGSDLYLIARGDGQDTINNYDTSINRTDILRLTNISFDDLSLSRNSNDLTLAMFGENQIVIRDFYVSGDYQLDRIEYDNGVGIVDHATGNIDFTSTDTAGVRAWSSWHQILNAQLEIITDEMPLDNGGNGTLIIDSSNTETWKSKRIGTDGASQIDWVQIINDDASFDQTDFDQANTESWTVRNDHKDSNGLLDWVQLKNDNGSLDELDIDQNHSNLWQEKNRHLDSHEQLDYIMTINDDITVDWQDEDQDNSQTWRTVNSHQLADGRLDWRHYINDDGTEDWLDLDQDNTQAWAEQATHKNTFGQDERRTIIWDNGSFDVIFLDGSISNATLLDVVNNQLWQQNTQHFNASGAYQGSDVLLDTGITADTVWLRQEGDNLEVSQIGTNNKMLIADWFINSPASQKTNFQLASGGTLLATEVQALVNAMASFAPPAVGQTSLTTAQHQALDGVIAANWS